MLTDEEIDAIIAGLHLDGPIEVNHIYVSAEAYRALRHADFKRRLIRCLGFIAFGLVIANFTFLILEVLRV